MGPDIEPLDPNAPFLEETAKTGRNLYRHAANGLRAAVTPQNMVGMVGGQVIGLPGRYATSLYTTATTPTEGMAKDAGLEGYDPSLPADLAIRMGAFANTAFGGLPMALSRGVMRPLHDATGRVMDRVSGLRAQASPPASGW